MKKITLLLAVLILAAFIGMPYITGKVAESETNKLVAQMSQGNQSNGYAEITKYERGFRSTQSSFKLLFPYADEEVEVLYSCDGSHGVISYSYKCQIDSLGDYKVFVDTHLEGSDPLSLTGSVSVLGSIKQRINLDVIENIEADGGKISSEGGFVSIETDPELKNFKFNGDIGASEFSVENVMLRIKSIEFNGDIESADDGVQLGEASFVTSNVIYSKSNSVLEIKGFKVDTKATGNRESIAFDYDMSAQDIVVKSDKKFPSIKKAIINLAGKGFDRSSVAQLTKTLQEVSEQGDFTPQQQAALLPAAEGLLKKGLGLILDVDVDFEKDEMTSKIDFQLIDDATITDLSAFIFDPVSLLDKLSLENSIFVPDTLLEFDDSLAVTVQNSPMFNRKGNGFKSELVLKKNNMSLNGEKITFDELMNAIL